MRIQGYGTIFRRRSPSIPLFGCSVRFRKWLSTIINHHWYYDHVCGGFPAWKIILERIYTLPKCESKTMIGTLKRESWLHRMNRVCSIVTNWTLLRVQFKCIISEIESRRSSQIIDLVMVVCTFDLTQSTAGLGSFFRSLGMCTPSLGFTQTHSYTFKEIFKRGTSFFSLVYWRESQLLWALLCRALLWLTHHEIDSRGERGKLTTVV